MWIHVPSECCPSSLASQDLTSESDWLCQSLEQSALWRGKPTAQRNWLRVCKTVPFMTHLSGQTLETSRASLGVERWIASLADSPAKTCPMLEKELDSRESGQDCGESTVASFVRYDPSTSLWRTFQLSLQGELTEFSGTWPKQGMMLHGECFPLKKSVPRTRENASSSWPTVTSQDWKHRGPNSSQQGLPEAVRAWPTPDVPNGGRGIPRTAEIVGHTIRTVAGRKVQLGLANAVRMWSTPNASKVVARWYPNKPEVSQLWATPEASSGTVGSIIPKEDVFYQTKHGKIRRITKKGHDASIGLGREVMTWATPTSRDWKDTGCLDNVPVNCLLGRQVAKSELGCSLPNQAIERHGQESLLNTPNSPLRLNARFVEWLMGMPMGWVKLDPLGQTNYEHWVMQSCLLVRQLLLQRSIKPLLFDMQNIHKEE